MTGHVAHLDWLGWIVVTIVVGSVGGVILAALCGKPWKPRVTLLVIAMLLTLTATLVIGIWVGGHVFSALMG